MKKGDIARQSIIDGIINMFKEQDSFIAFVDKKIYVEAQDGPGGEQIQFAISLTMPKNPIVKDPGAFGEVEDTKANNKEIELSQADKEAIERLKKQLGI